ncbi:MAG: hypothetical protein PUP46_10570 [Endozoicomonas sp. (ex Botrylloides leachii)]|nr:hypothetical protein [Endozoicomonas sp. (ex Botrylloides leachii)]
MDNKKSLILFDVTHSAYDAEELKKTTLKSIEVIKIYNCFHGKKIWNESQRQTYTNNCLYASFDDAAAFAETIRARGRTIYIKEMPALLIKNNNYGIILTQLNESCPLTAYSAMAIREDCPKGTMKIEQYGNNYLAKGAPMEGVLLSFRHNSRFWKKEQPDQDSVIVAYADNKLTFDPLKTTELKAWKSKSGGKNQLLNWNEEPSNIRQSAILRHYRQAGFQEKKSSMFEPVKAKKLSQNTLLKAIKDQVKNDLFFFYREHDIDGYLGGTCEFWVELNNQCDAINSSYLLYIKSPKKGIEIFEVEQTTYEITHRLDLSKWDLAA